MNCANIHRRGLMFILSSPSGAGKTTITRALMENNADLINSVSATTRTKRTGEVHGEDYYFIEKHEFDSLIENGEMLEYAKVFGNYYGTPRQPVEEALTQGKDVIFDIDWQGRQKLAEMVPHDLVTVFILPPSRRELERRLRARNRDDEHDIQLRMDKASDEMTHYLEYDYVVINTNIDHTISQVQTILDAERHKRQRLSGLSDFVRGLKEGSV